MALVHLVRHAEPAATYADHPDPGLSALGRAQAEAVVARLLPLGGDLLTSPLRRAVETGEPLAAARGVDLVVASAVAEIHSPSSELVARTAWLRTALASRWGDLDTAQRAWRDAVVARLLAVDGDAVVFTHFVAINVAIGAATGDDRVVCASVGHASVTTFEVVAGAGGRRLELVALGDEQPTVVR